VYDHRRIGERREMRERQRAAERHRRLVRHADQRKQEDPASLGTGERDDGRHHRQIPGEEHRAEVQVREQVRVEEIEQVPRDGGVRDERHGKPHPRQPGQIVEDERVVEQRAGGEEREAHQPQFGNRPRVELNQPRTLPIGGPRRVELEVERLRRQIPARLRNTACHGSPDYMRCRPAATTGTRTGSGRVSGSDLHAVSP
jgi:hypothetical protein